MKVRPSKPVCIALVLLCFTCIRHELCAQSGDPNGDRNKDQNRDRTQVQNTDTLGLSYLNSIETDRVEAAQEKVLRVARPGSFYQSTLLTPHFLIDPQTDFLYALLRSAEEAKVVGMSADSNRSEPATVDTLSKGTVQTLVDRSDLLSDDEFMYAGHIRYTIDGSYPLRNSRLNPLTLAATGTIYTGIMVGLHIYQINTFWNQRSKDFTVHEDGNYAKDVDKFGHFYGATIVSYYSTEVLQGAGASVESARIWGTLMGLMYQTYVEVEDGYGSGWSFSPTDMYGNVAGASFYLLQFYIPELQNITEKWIYTPATWIGETPRKEGQTFIDDYSSNTFFFSLKVHNILPEKWQAYWPRWLALAGGYAARGLDTPDEDRKLIIALDYDLPELLPDFRQTVGGTFGDILNWLKQSFNYFKFPSPAIEIGEHGMTRFNLLYPFKLSLAGIKF